MRFSAIRFLTLSSLPLLTSGCWCSFSFSPKAWTEASEDLAFGAADTESLRVVSHNGAVTVSADDGADTITAVATIKAGGADEADAELCLAAIELHTPLEGSERVLTWRWIEDKERTWSASVSFDVKIPSILAVKVETHNGAVSVDGTRSKARLVTHNGSVTALNHEGDLLITTHNGEVRSESTSSTITLVTHNGSIDSRIECGGRLDGNLTTHNGSISVTLGEGASAKVVGSTSNGRLSVNREMDITVKKKKVIVGQVGTGEGMLEIETHNGSITLN